MDTIAQKKARINGWIKEYEKRIEEYKEKYGYESRKFVMFRNNCKWKIKDWKKKYQELSKPRLDKIYVVKAILGKSKEYFISDLEYNRGYSLDMSPFKYYIAKLVQDLGLNNKYTARQVLKSEYRKVIERRDVLTKNKEHKSPYKTYREKIIKHLKDNKIKYE